MAARCLISLGANVGNRPQAIEGALRELAGYREVRVLCSSRLRETLPVGGPSGQAAFLNAAALLETSLGPAELLALLLRIEAESGRKRDVRWGPRPLDLDMLLFDDAVLTGPSLLLPHPRMAWRRFVLEPAAEIAPDMMHPGIGWSIARLLEHMNTTPHYLATTGSIGAGKTELAARLTAQEAARLVSEEIDLTQLAGFYANPASRAWPVELEFLHQRSRLLAAGAGIWQDRSKSAVSDFWFDQSAAFARVWLVPEQYTEFEAHFEAARRTVVRPRLVVQLEATGQQLHERVLRRGRVCERRLTADELYQIALAIDQQTRRPDVGPVLRIRSDDADAAFEEVSAAFSAMA